MGGNLSLRSTRRAFAEPVRDAWRIDPGYPSTNDVWRIEAHDGPRALKVPRHASEAGQSCFWRGMETLFGCNPMREIGNQPALSTYLNSHGTIPVPRVLAHEASDNALGSPLWLASGRRVPIQRQGGSRGRQTRRAPAFDPSHPCRGLLRHVSGPAGAVPGATGGHDGATGVPWMVCRSGGEGCTSRAS